MNLLLKVINSNDFELDDIINLALKEKNISSNKIEKIGFLNGALQTFNVFKGFIPFDTRIKYSNFSVADYSMETTDFYYEFARLLKKYNINSKGNFIIFLLEYINNYFGVSTGIDRREEVLNDVAFNTSTTDEEYFLKLEKNEIGNFKGKNIAMCTERTAMAQNLLSLYGFESYYCLGCIDNNGNKEPHCFNIVRTQNCYRLLDYSVPVPVFYDNKVCRYLPFYGDIAFEELENIVNNKKTMEFLDYEYVYNENKYQTVNCGERKYVVGEFSFDFLDSKTK